MAEIEGIDKLLVVLPRKRLGKFNQLGMIQLGFSNLGASDIFFDRSPLGIFVLGGSILGDLILLSGIYRTDNVSGYTRYYREPYYITRNPRYEPQQINRQKFADAIIGWQGLTDEQKAIYNKRVEKLQMSGYNLYIKEYMYA